MILLAHLHGDYIYGLKDPATSAPKFPDAEILVPAVELRWWMAGSPMDLGPTRVGLSRRIRETIAIWRNVRAFDAGEVAHRIRAVPACGHSPGHTAYLLDARRAATDIRGREPGPSSVLEQTTLAAVAGSALRNGG